MALQFIYIIKQKIFGQPMPPPDSFRGQKALITGGTAGLGLATAIHLAELGASSITITCRDASRGKAAVERIKEAAGSSDVEVRLLELDMSSYASVVAFTEAVKRDWSLNGGLDWICLNAGVNNMRWEESPEGWEMTLQVNVLSTILISTLLLPWLKTMRRQRQTPAHLTFVSSALHLMAEFKDWDQLSKNKGILRHYSPKENWVDGTSQYSLSKLMLEYAACEQAIQALNEQGKPDVIFNTCCPGLVKTNLSDGIKEMSFLGRILYPVVMLIAMQRVDVGARTYLAAGITTEEEHGKFVRTHMPDGVYNWYADTFFKSQAAQRAQNLLWKEIQQELGSRVPAVNKYLAK